MTPLTEARKQQIIDEEPSGIWLVLNEEYPRDGVNALLCGELEASREAAVRDMTSFAKSQG